MFAEAIETLLRDHCTPAVVRRIEGGADAGPLWQAIEASGFLELLAPESAGGAGLPLGEVFAVLLQLGRHAVPVPAAQAIAARALLPAGAVPSGPLTLAPTLQREGGRVVCPLVPFGTVATSVLAADERGWVLLDARLAERVPTGIAFHQAATLIWREAEASAGLHGALADAAAVESFGAALHAALLAGSMTRVFEMTLQYCNDRVQFGRSLGKFQAVQHQLAVMAEQVAASRIAAEWAFQGSGAAPDPIAAAIAKARTSEAAAVVASLAHALHGAIGVTEAYDLQLHTRRLHDWRSAHGAETYWHRKLGAAVLAQTAPLAEFVRRHDG